MLLIIGSKNPKPLPVFKEHFKSLTIEVFFDEKRYKELYPKTNTYPLKSQLTPVESEADFSDFLFSMIIEGLGKAKNTETLPHNFLMNTLLNFKAENFKTEWVHKIKTIRDLSLKATLHCRLTANYFSLKLTIERKKKEIFIKELLRTLPCQDFYSLEFKNIVVQEGKLMITKNMYEEPVLFTLPLSELS